MTRTQIRRRIGDSTAVALADTAERDSIPEHGPLPQRHTMPSRLELAGELSDLAAGLGILTVALAPLALPALALTAVLAIPLLIPVVLGATLAAPFLLASRWLRVRDRP